MRSALVAILGALAAIGLASCGGGPRSAPGNRAVEDEASAAVTGSAWTAPSASAPAAQSTATPTETPPEVIDGVPVRRLTVGEPEEVPAGKLVAYNVGKYAGDGVEPALLWRYRTPAGALWSGDFLAALPASANPWSITTDLEHGTIAIASCIRGFCGGYSVPEPTSEGELVISNDGGVSWSNPTPLPRYSDLVGAFNGRVLVSTSTDQTKLKSFFRWYPDGEVVVPVPDAYPRLISGALLWQKEDGALFRLDGTVLRQAVAIRQARNLDVARDGSGWQRWFRPRPGVEQFRIYLARITPPGQLERAYSWDLDAWFTSFAGDNTVYGNALLTEYSQGVDFAPVRFDLEAGVIHPLRALEAAAGKSTFIDSVRDGPFARVAGAGIGDCLNVREEAGTDARVLGCYRDGVLLRLLPDFAPRPAVDWVPVQTPDGRPGFASVQYLDL